MFYAGTNVNSNKMDAAEAPGSEAEADDVPKTQSQVKRYA